jgi:hypothetical protein
VEIVARFGAQLPYFAQGVLNAGSSPLADPQLLTNERRDLGASESRTPLRQASRPNSGQEKPTLVNKMYLMAYFYQSEHLLE